MSVPLPTRYRAVLDGAFRFPSQLLGYLDPLAGMPALEDVRRRLEEGTVAIRDVRTAQAGDPCERWALEGDAGFPHRVSCRRLPPPAPAPGVVRPGGAPPPITGDPRGEVWAIASECVLPGQDPTAEYHEQLRILDRAAPAAGLVVASATAGTNPIPRPAATTSGTASRRATPGASRASASAPPSSRTPSTAACGPGPSSASRAGGSTGHGGRATPTASTSCSARSVGDVHPLGSTQIDFRGWHGKPDARRRARLHGARPFRDVP